MHKGFALVDVLQVCVTYFNMYDYYDKKVYELKEHDPADYEKAHALIREWDYNKDAPIALGVLYRKEAPTFDNTFLTPPVSGGVDREAKIRELLSEAI